MNNENQHIPSGYKPSPLGIIPEDWEVKRLGKVGEVFSGGTPNTEIQEYWNGNIDWCTPTDITLLNGAVYIERTAFKITDLGLKSSSAVLLPPNSIIVCTRATIGNAAISLHQIATNQGFKNIVPNENIDTLFLYYTIVNNKIRLIRLGNGSTFLEVSKSDFENLTIPVPPFSEQQRIVSVLSLWDTAIEKQTVLIEKLTLRKRGLMQQLLTGKKRLKGFSGEWKEVRLGEIGVFFKGGGVPKDKITNSGNKCLTYGDLYTKYDFVISDVKSYIDDHTANESVKIRYGDICFAGSGETKEDIGKCAAFIDNKYGYAGGDIIVFRANDCNPITLSYILNSSDVIRQKSNMGQGHSVVHIYPYQLEKLLIKLPSRAEQDAIATILMESDKEIEIQKQKLAAMQAQKKGLMQVLLTGKRRIK